jgi:hypothetical protein
MSTKKRMHPMKKMGVFLARVTALPLGLRISPSSRLPTFPRLVDGIGGRFVIKLKYRFR